MIDVYFYSDKHDLKFADWDETISCRPLVGDLVKSRCGKIGKISSICHSPGHRHPETPVLEIELI